MKKKFIYLFFILSAISCNRNCRSFAPEKSRPSESSPPALIYYGDPVRIEEVPWQISIHSNGNHICGGSIIDSFWIITAAHCFFDPETRVRDVYEINVSILAGSNDLFGGKTRFDIDTIIIFKEYNTTTFDNDIALIKLKDPLNLEHPSPLPIELPLGVDVQNLSETSHKVMIAGWGLKEDGDYPSILHRAELPMASQSNCLSFHPSVSAHMICAGKWIGGVDACSADSGGPLYYSEQNRHYLLGIISWGIGCGRPQTYGVYTDVQDYLSWIESERNLVNPLFK